MQLSVLERLQILTIIPREGDLTTLRVVRDLTAALSFTEAEHQELQFEVVDGGVRWQQQAVGEVEIPMGPTARRVVTTALEVLDQQKQLKLEFLPLYERFLGEPPATEA